MVTAVCRIRWASHKVVLCACLGVTATIAVCAGIAPYMALELAVFDLMPPDLAPFARGFSSALLATTLCYPLDTVR